MGKTEWTKEQLAAITLRGNLLVAAAAGSGKTAVLVERVLRRIMDAADPIELDRLLVVTFTKAAAAEMRERVGKALEDALWLEHDKVQAERLLRQLHLLARANITTLHSFCLELARQHFYRLELDPAFRIADEAEVELLRQDVIEDMFDSLYEQGEPSFHRLVEAFGSDRDDRPLMEQVLKLYIFAFSHARPQAWLQGLAAAYRWHEAEELAQSPWGKAVRQGLADRVSAVCDLLARAAAIAHKPAGPVPYLTVLEDELRSLNVLARELTSGNWSGVEEAVASVEFGRLPAARGQGSKQGKEESAPLSPDDPVRLREQARKLRDEGKGIFNKLKEELFAWPLAEQIPALRRTGDLVEDLAKLVLNFAGEYSRLKKRRNLVDFNDLEHMALSLLEQDNEAGPLALSLQERFGEVLVDEYQDINPVQERILQLVSGFPEGSCFMVGDVKQSIYRFRMADPGLFLEKYMLWPHWQSKTARESASASEIGGASAGEELPERSNLVIDLARNFRSRLEVVEGVNFLFRQFMTAGSAEIAYDDKAALQYGASYVSSREGLLTAEGPVEVHLFDPKEVTLTVSKGESEGGVSGTGNEGIGPLEAAAAQFTGDEITGEVLAGNEAAGDELEERTREELEAARHEARFVGLRIKKMVENGEFQIFDKKFSTFRPVRYADIVILMRSYSALAPLYAEELQNMQVPVFADTKSGYFGFSEVETIISLLKVIDNPRQDIPLAAVLRSPLVGLNGAELGKLRLVLPQGEFYDALALAVGAPAQARMTEVSGKDQDTTGDSGKDAAAALSSDLSAKLTSFWQNLQKWRTFARRHSLAELLSLLYEETGYLAYVGTLPGGPQRQANLRVLYDRACRFEGTHYRGLFRFLRFLEKFREQGKDMGSARVLGENEDVVRLLTVHASKGLEFPVVFVVGLGSAFNKRSLSGRLLMHSELGVGAPVIDVDNNVEYPSIIQQGIKQALAQEGVAEEMRILYVALTRAKEKLLLYGSLKKLSEKMEKWQELASNTEESFADAQLRSARCFLDWIGPALARQNQTPFPHNSHWKINVNGSPAYLEGGWDGIEGVQSKEESLGKGAKQGADEGIRISTRDDVELGSDEDIVLDIDKSEGQDVEENEEEDWVREIESRLNWEYPFTAEVRQIGKTSVSELKRRLRWYGDEETASTPWADGWAKSEGFTAVRPHFLQPGTRELSAAEKGTALHIVMQQLPLEELKRSWTACSFAEREQWLTHFLALLEQREVLTPEQRAAVPGARILAMLQSPVGARLLSGDKVLREVPFTLSLKLPGLEQPVLVQGVIDTLLFSQNGVEVLDYKTDKINPEREDPQTTLLKRYSMQLGIYAVAAETLLKQKVTQCTIYALAPGLEVKLKPEELRGQLEDLGILLNAHKGFLKR